ncbi:MAG: hypothetical protein ACJA0U_001169 [Salibacteraceae bacterium]|jgi:hypothetical protein
MADTHLVNIATKKQPFSAPYNSLAKNQTLHNKKSLNNDDLHLVSTCPKAYLRKL